MSAAKSVGAKAVTINVLGREFRVAAPEGEERQLLASVDLVNRKMKEIRDTGKVVGNERIAIMAALNLAHEQLHAGAAESVGKSTDATSRANITVDEAFVRGKINAFEATLEKAISEQEKLF
jgi:cell division protein ZapA